MPAPPIPRPPAGGRTGAAGGIGGAGIPGPRTFPGHGARDRASPGPRAQGSGIPGPDISRPWGQGSGIPSPLGQWTGHFGAGNGVIWVLGVRGGGNTSGVGVLAGPGTPRDPKSHLFVTKWVAIRPFCVFLRPVCAEFRSGARQIGLPPSISTFFQQFVDPKMPKMPKSGHVFEGPETARAGLAIPPHRGPRGPMWRLLGAIPAHNGPKGPIMGPRGPMWRLLGAIPPHKGPRGPLGGQIRPKWGPGAPGGAKKL